MKVFVEKEAEDFLEGQGFNVVKRVFIKDKKSLKSSLKGLKFPVVMKVSGSKIIHKYRLGGVKTNVNYSDAVKVFDSFRKIKGFEGVMVQEQVEGEEFLLGIKKTPEFGHVIAFGIGGVYTEKINDVSFRVCPINRGDVKKMFKEVRIGDLNNSQKKFIEGNILNLCGLVKKYPSITELDINPFMVGEKGFVVDARILWE